MSRRRAAWTADSGVTTDELLAAMYGSRERVEHMVMPGCQDRCCRPGSVVVSESQVVAAIWRGVWWALGLEAAGVLLTVLVLVLVWLVRWGMAW